MFGLDDLILGGLMAGGSLLSGIGGSSSAKKQNKIAAAKQAETNQMNAWIQEVTNARNQQLQQEKNAFDATLGQSLVARGDAALARADALPSVDLDAFMKAGDTAGYNRVTWLNSGALNLFTNNAARQSLSQMGAAFVGQGTALQSPGFTTIGQTLAGTSPTVAEPSMLSAIGGAVSAGAGALGSSYQNNQRVDAANQSSMLQYLAAVQFARKSGNALAGLGTPSFETSSGASGGSVAAVAAKLSGKADALNLYGYKVNPPEINSGNVDPSVMNPQGGRGALSGLTDGFYTSVSDWYWKLAGRNMGADATIATDNWFQGPGFKTTGPLEEHQRRLQADKSGNSTYRSPADFLNWAEGFSKGNNWYGELFGSKPAY